MAAAPVPVTPDYSAWLGKPFADSMGVALVAPWASAYVAADGKQEIVQERLATTIAIVRNCEAMVNAVRPR
ncbi:MULTISPECIES: hypothetical protein [unclassified Sphingobium]|uniref:hypothetical protein n=1 Tax=unclassified Sphingobium TaxID=2611147 RepID=UPI0022255BEB|nr:MULTISPECIES: hypothetical protein [unclassified Sphingobium]MCW2395183.1 hypothetical protein [Sphingobium sp. B8D3B]MCW2418697.1 hypothetical protein [Sphingobium sp. B8D3C]